MINIYNIDDVSKLVKHAGITRTSLYRAISTGRLNAVKIGKRYIITEDALTSFLQGTSKIKIE